MRVWVGGEGAEQWREISGWPPPGVAEQRWYLGPSGSLRPTEPAGPEPAAGGPVASFRYDPADPTPSPGGAIMAMNGGSRDNRPVERRLDVLVFSSDPLGEPVEILGEVAAEVFLTRDNPYADPLTGTVRVSLVGAAHRFGRGHRVRLQVAGGAFPRFARNPGNGQLDATAADLVPTQYDIGLDSAHPSALLLPVAGA